MSYQKKLIWILEQLTSHHRRFLSWLSLVCTNAILLQARNYVNQARMPHTRFITASQGESGTSHFSKPLSDRTQGIYMRLYLTSRSHTNLNSLKAPTTSYLLFDLECHHARTSGLGGLIKKLRQGRDHPVSRDRCGWIRHHLVGHPWPGPVN